MLTAGSAPDAANRGGTNPIQVGLGVQLGGDHHQLQPGLDPDHRAATDLMIQGDGMFVVQQRRREPLHPRRRVHLRRDRQPGHAGRRPGAGLPPSTPTATPTTGAWSTSRLPTDDGADADRRTSADVLQHRRRRQASPRISDDAARHSPRSRSPTSPTRWVWRRSATPLPRHRQLRRRRDRHRRRGPARRARPRPLEMSNVDLAAEFTNLILAQRGFQASSRVITTSDQVLEELVNIKR